MCQQSGVKAALTQALRILIALFTAPEAYLFEISVGALKEFAFQFHLACSTFRTKRDILRRELKEPAASELR